MNSRPSKYESHPLTTRPELPPNQKKVIRRFTFVASLLFEGMSRPRSFRLLENDRRSTGSSGAAATGPVVFLGPGTNLIKKLFCHN